MNPKIKAYALDYTARAKTGHIEPLEFEIDAETVESFEGISAVVANGTGLDPAAAESATVAILLALVERAVEVKDCLRFWYNPPPGFRSLYRTDPKAGPWHGKTRFKQLRRYRQTRTESFGLRWRDREFNFPRWYRPEFLRCEAEEIKLPPKPSAKAAASNRRRTRYTARRDATRAKLATVNEQMAEAIRAGKGYAKLMKRANCLESRLVNLWLAQLRQNT